MLSHYISTLRDCIGCPFALSGYQCLGCPSSDNWQSPSKQTISQKPPTTGPMYQEPATRLSRPRVTTLLYSSVGGRCCFLPRTKHWAMIHSASMSPQYYPHLCILYTLSREEIRSTNRSKGGKTCGIWFRLQSIPELYCTGVEELSRRHLSLRLSFRHFGNTSRRRYGLERYGFALLCLVSIVKKPVEDVNEIDLGVFILCWVHKYRFSVSQARYIPD